MRPPGPCSQTSHRFAPSGWCQHARCGWRDDGQSKYHYDPHYTDPPLAPPAPDVTEPRHQPQGLFA